jgi:hypothetical protein
LGVDRVEAFCPSMMNFSPLSFSKYKSYTALRSVSVRPYCSVLRYVRSLICYRSFISMS